MHHNLCLVSSARLGEKDFVASDGIQRPAPGGRVAAVLVLDAAPVLGAAGQHGAVVLNALLGSLLAFADGGLHVQLDGAGLPVVVLVVLRVVSESDGGLGQSLGELGVLVPVKVDVRLVERLDGLGCTTAWVSGAR